MPRPCGNSMSWRADVPREDRGSPTNADDLDSSIGTEWLEREVPDPEAQRSLRQVLEGLMTTPACRHVGAHRACTRRGPAARWRRRSASRAARRSSAWSAGCMRLAVRLAADLGDAVQLNAPSATRCDTATGRHVTPEDGELDAARCVVAVPPSGWSTHRRSTPTLPDGISAVGRADAARVRSSSVSWCTSGPSGETPGYSGLVIDDTGPFAFLVDNSSPDRSEGVLATFLSATRSADDGAMQRSATEAAAIRRRMLDRSRSAAFGAEAFAPVDYVDRDWGAVPWVRWRLLRRDAARRVGVSVAPRCASRSVASIGRLLSLPHLERLRRGSHSRRADREQRRAKLAEVELAGVSRRPAVDAFSVDSARKAERRRAVQPGLPRR